MALVTTHNDIENQIEVFLENVRKNGSTVGVPLPPETLERLPFYRKHISSESQSEGSQFTLNSVSDDSPTTTTTTTTTESYFQNYLLPTSNGVDAFSADDITTLDDDNMDDGNCPVTVKDVVDLLHAKHAIITGGKSQEGCPLITFPDNSGLFCGLSDDDYKKLMMYLTSIPSLQEADLGFVLIVDRRNDTWNGVKSVLLKIGGYFPGLIQAVYVIRPSSFFQKAISEVRNKLFKEDFKFNLIVCNNIEELHEHVDSKELTKDLDGCISYDHKEWIDQRAAVEAFSRRTREISQSLRRFTARLQETELPNDVQCTKDLLRVLKKEYDDLKDDLSTTSDSGLAVLKVLRHPCTRSPSAISPCSSSNDVCPDSKLINVTTVERLLVQLEETERVFDNFWRSHEDKLRQCLELRRFEHEFRDLQVNLDDNLKLLAEMNEMGDSVARVDVLLKETEDFLVDCEDDVGKARQLSRIGEQLIENKHYAIDSIQPKCIELQRFCDDFTDRLNKRLESLRKYRNLQERVECANKWCARGVNLLAGQQFERCSSPEFARSALDEVDAFLQSSSEFKLDNPREFHNYFKDMITPETTALVQQVLKRIDDVQTMCEKKKASLQKLAAKPSRPVQPVVPEPAVPLTTNCGNATTTSTSGSSSSTSPNPGSVVSANGSNKISSSGSADLSDDAFDFDGGTPAAAPKKYARKARTLPKQHQFSTQNQNGSSNENEDGEMLINRQKHVMTELLDTERVYVAELNSILKGYIAEMKNPVIKDSLPDYLIGKEDILFGNLEDIYHFHKDIFLRDLENCVNTPELIGLCFTQRKESFHDLYTVYCQNKPKSEALRRNGGDNIQVFKDCQRKLGHKLPLSAYLLKPVQRITKYQLLLKDLLKYSKIGQGKEELQEAVDCMLDVLKYVNDSMHQVAITGFTGNLSEMGRLLTQGSFNLWYGHKSDRLKDLRLKPMQRHLFLYEKAVLFCKKNGKNDDHATYSFKRCLKMSQVGLTESVKGTKGGDVRKFELWTPARKEVYVIQAPTMEIKDAWIKEIKSVLMEQFAHLKGENIKQHSAKIKKISSLNGVRSVISNETPAVHKARSQTTSWHDDHHHQQRSLSSKAVSEEELHVRFTSSTLSSSPLKTGVCSNNVDQSNNDDEEPPLRPRSRSVSLKTTLLRSGTESYKDDTTAAEDGLADAEARFKADQDEECDEVWSDAEDYSDSEAEDDIFGQLGNGIYEQRVSYCGRLVALADYDAVDSHEVTLHEGDIVDLLKTGCAGWWFVRIVGTEDRGWAPASYLERIAKRNSKSSPSASSQDSICGGSMLHRVTSKSSVTSSTSVTS